MFSTTIKKKYWLMKMEDQKAKGYFWEYKQTTQFWERRLGPMCNLNRMWFPIDGVFLVGRVPHRVKVFTVNRTKREYIPERYAAEMPTVDCYALQCVTEGGLREIKQAKKELGI